MWSQQNVSHYIKNLFIPHEILNIERFYCEHAFCWNKIKKKHKKTYMAKQQQQQQQKQIQQKQETKNLDKG